MLHIFTRLLRGVTVLGHWTLRSHTGSAPLRCFSVGASSHKQRDYSLPNVTWSEKTRELYRKYEELSKSGAWRKIPSYNNTVNHKDNPPEVSRSTRVFTRITEEDGVGFEFSMFHNMDEKRMICIFQPGPYLEGYLGYTHGGCIATILDTTLGFGAIYLYGNVATANLNINFLNPVLLGSTVIVDTHVEKVEGRKVLARGQIRSHDDQILHSEGTGLFIKMNQRDIGGFSNL